tara:strand:+ start:344 stop:508 length:165 start_codon:yes stop_codon:yes gene_type:complete
MDISVRLRAEDCLKLKQFLSKNPSTKSLGPFPEHLDSGTIARICFGLENALNKI